MKLIIGLGNPGKEYYSTRHNAGFLVLDELQKMRLPKDIVVRKSDVFMNESGRFVKKSVDKYKLDLLNLFIVHDDLDIKLGEYKIQFGRGPKDHNGLKSVDEVLGSDQYWHVRVGIDNRKSEPFDSFDRLRTMSAQGHEYVLQDFTDDEKKILEGIIKEICKKLVTS